MELQFVLLVPTLSAFISFVAATVWASFIITKAAREIQDKGFFMYHGRTIKQENLDAFDKRVGIRALTAPVVTTMGVLALCLIAVATYGVIFPY